MKSGVSRKLKVEGKAFDFGPLTFNLVLESALCGRSKHGRPRTQRRQRYIRSERT